LFGRVVSDIKGIICFYNIGNSTRNYEADGEDDLYDFEERSAR